MSLTDTSVPQLIPNWIFEQDFLVFLSFFGWMLVGLLAFSKPFAREEREQIPWLWIGFYAFSQALSDFLRTLSFSDSFFRAFNLEVGFEMLGYGLLVEAAIRYARPMGRRDFFPLSALGGLFLGLSIEIGDLLYTLVVSGLVAFGAIVWSCRFLAKAAKEETRFELYFVMAGLVMVLPTWFLAPGRLDLLIPDRLPEYEDFPYYGFDLLILRILAGWTVLAAFWRYRLQRRILSVVPAVGGQLQLWGYRVLPVALAVVVCGSFLVTTWNGERAKQRLAEDMRSRAETAAIALDTAELPRLIERSRSEPGKLDEVAQQLAALQSIGSGALAVYLWTEEADGMRLAAYDSERVGRPVWPESLLGEESLHADGNARVAGPFAAGIASLLHVSVPVRHAATGETVCWLGIDFSGTAWFRSVSLARLQTIIIAGLIMALVIFFLYYQIEHESEADLVLAKERAEAADRAKSEFLAVISHEIRTPLQSVLGYSDLLKSTQLDDKQRSCLDTIQSEGKILLRIVQDILDFSNLRKASFQLEWGPVRLRRLIEETYRTISPMAQRKGLKPSLEISDDIPELVEADGVRLRQVLLNLFGNSVKYTESGEVRLKAFLDTEATEGDLPLLFEISDTGVGIKESDLSRLFEPFIQLEHSSKFPREGAGLGLAIVNRIVELMGGRIDVVSEVGKGSVFTARFSFEEREEDLEEAALARAAAAEEAAAASTLAERLPLKILVVDDNPMVRRLILQYLESLGYSADERDGGAGAVECGHEYDLLVMDLRMPEVDGPQAASQIRERTGSAVRPWIVAVSASLLEEEVARARAAGVNDFLGKPFYAGQLAERIEAISWIEEKRVVPSDPVEAPAQEVAEHRPLFIGPADVETPATEAEPPKSIFGGIDSYPKEAVEAAIAEVYSKHADMVRLAEEGDWAMVKEEAHYLANTAMALGIDQLYLDSKSLETAAAESRSDRVVVILDELIENFRAWAAD